MMRLLILLLLLAGIQACKHPLAIVGEGDIVELLGSGRGCSLEEFQQQAPNCTDNNVSEGYFVRYEAQPRPGWRFLRWDGPCNGDVTNGFCVFETAADLVALWDELYPELVPPASTAVFEQIENPASGVGFYAVDAALKAKSVSTESVEGLWIFFSDGNVDLRSELIPGTPLVIDTTVHLWAFLVSVHLKETNGETRIHIDSCSRTSQSNSGFSAGMALNPITGQFDITWKQLTVWGGSLAEPYASGDASLSLYGDRSSIVTIVDNTEMRFANEYRYTDREGLLTGGFTSRYKARKINDDSFATLGQFEVNGQQGDSHCFSYSNFEEHSETTMEDGGISTTDLIAEKFNVVSFPDFTLGRSDLIYQSLNSQSIFNGISTPPQIGEVVSLLNTSGLYSAQVNTVIPGSQADVQVSLSDALDMIIEFDITAAGSSETFMGVIESLP